MSFNEIRHSNLRKTINPAIACIVVALVIAFALIAVLFATRDTNTHREIPARISGKSEDMSRNINIKKPVVYFEATRDSNETTRDVHINFVPPRGLSSNVKMYVFRETETNGVVRKLHFITFEDIVTNIGGGMFLNGSFYAPFAGLYW